MSSVRWAYALTTVPSRAKDLLPRTLDSLKRGGFEKPHLFVDGYSDCCKTYSKLDFSGLTIRWPKCGAYGNWVCTLWELYVKNPSAQMYAIFQDDILCVAGLRAYLEGTCKAPDSYWNCYTTPQNQVVCPYAGRNHVRGWYRSNQRGHGGLGLVFTREGVQLLLKHPHMVEKPLDVARGDRSLDGAVIESMKRSGWDELVHNPSLLQHTGTELSTVGNLPRAKAVTFPGEGIDIRQLMG